MYIDEFAAQRISENESRRRHPERPAQTIARHWRTDMRSRAVRKTHGAPSWLRMFRAL